MRTFSKHPLRVIVSGCCGRMGQRLVTLAHHAKDLALVGALESAGHASLGRDIGECAGVGRLGIPIESRLERIARRGDVVVEFSTPAATAAHAAVAARLRCPMVIGTTGLTTTQQAAVRRASRAIPVLMAPNMSVGVNILYQLAEQATKTLGDHYDIEIVETHHAGKKDAPSGTAKRLAEVLAQARQQTLNQLAVHGRHGEQPRRSHQEIGIHAVRAGDVVGDHTVIFATKGERVELTHRASSRDTFAYGALRAARFITRQRAGLYNMRDVLQLQDHRRQ